MWAQAHEPYSAIAASPGIGWLASFACGTSCLYTACGTSDLQYPAVFAKPTIPKNTTATPAANAHVGIRRGAGSIGKLIRSAPSAGHTTTHSKHPVHSADLIVTSLSTDRFAGHAFAHFAQSMQVSVFRRIRIGLNTDASP